MARSFGRFQISAELGAGAMGTVYRAYDEMLGRTVAIKTLHVHDAGVRERFLREARAIGAVSHPNIVAVYDAGVEGDTPYLVMEHAASGAFSDRVKTGPQARETVCQVGIQIAGALAAAHAVGILHRDVKPANILGTDGRTWKLADFGIARLPDSKLTITGQFLGSPAYAAPESLRAGEFSPASDVYGLGATLYEALAGQPPYGNHDMASLIRKLEEEPTPIAAVVAAPGALGDAIMAALARDPARRPSALQLAAMLATEDPRSTAVATVALVAPLAGVGVGGVGVGGVGGAGAAVATAAVTTAAGGAGSPWLVRGIVIAAAVALIGIAAAVGSSGPHPTMGAAVAPGAVAPAVIVPVGTQGAPAGLPPGSPPGSPQYVDQNGNPIDEATARAILEQARHDDDDDDEHDRQPPGWKRAKKHKGDD